MTYLEKLPADPSNIILLLKPAERTGAVLGGFLFFFLEFPETRYEIACTPTICLGDKNYKELYIVYYIMAFPIG